MAYFYKFLGIYLLELVLVDWTKTAFESY